MSREHRPALAVCSWSLRAAPPDELVAALRRVGIDAVQLALSPLADADAPAFAKVLHDGGIRIASGMMALAGEDYSSLESIARTGGVRPDATWPANRRHAETVAEIAAGLDLGLVTFHAGFIPEDPSDPERATLLDRLGVVADAFAAHGVDVAFETGQETAATLLTALTDLGRPNVGVNFDPANMILYDKGEPVEALRALAPYVRQIHVKDALPTTEPGTWGQEVPAGQGAVPWDAFFDVATSLATAVDFVIEREAGETREADIAAAHALVRSHLTRLECGR